MPKFFAYLRVSRDGQDPENQKLGLLEYANAHGFAPLEIVQETASRAKDWRSRKLGQIIAAANAGDVLLTPEFSRMAGSALAVLEILKAASEKGLIVHVTKQQIVMDGTLQSEIMATVLGMAAQIERHFIQTRTKEALQVARESGKRLGRPKGTGKAGYKLDEKLEQVQAFVNMGMPMARAAGVLGVTPKTYSAFVKNRKIRPTGAIASVSLQENQGNAERKNQRPSGQ